MPNCAGGGGKASDPFSLFEGASDVDGFRPVLELDELVFEQVWPLTQLYSVFVGFFIVGKGYHTMA